MLSKIHAALIAFAIVSASVVLYFSPTACHLPRDEAGNVDLAALADQIELVRLDIESLVPIASPEFQTRVLKVTVEVVKVEVALRSAAAGGPIVGVQTAAQAALKVADSVVADLKASGKDTGELQFYIGLAQVALRHLKFGEVEKASESLPAPDETPNPQERP